MTPSAAIAALEAHTVVERRSTLPSVVATLTEHELRRLALLAMFSHASHDTLELPATRPHLCPGRAEVPQDRHRIVIKSDRFTYLVQGSRDHSTHQLGASPRLAAIAIGLFSHCKRTDDIELYGCELRRGVLPHRTFRELRRLGWRGKLYHTVDKQLWLCDPQPHLRVLDHGPNPAWPLTEFPAVCWDKVVRLFDDRAPVR